MKGRFQRESSPTWTGDEATYNAVHLRKKSEHGLASNHACVDCGGQAKEWSYDHSDPNQRVTEDGVYSLDLNRYVPRCVPCHRAFDMHGPHTALYAETMRMRAMYENGASVRAVGEAFGVDHSNVVRRLHRVGTKMRGRMDWRKR